MGKLENKVALITGGARGMGANHVKRFVSEGAKVYFTDILEEDGQKLADELGSQAVFVKHDVASEEGWKNVINIIDQTEGKLDILVNNAGIGENKPIGEYSLQDYMRIININQVSVFLGLTYALPLLKKGSNSSVVNISSIEGLSVTRGSSAYASTKYAVRGLTQGAALEFAPFNIRVNSVHPGAVSTPFITAAGAEEVVNELAKKIPLQRIGQPDDLTNMVLFLASEDAGYCTAGEYVVDGGITAGY